MRYGVSDQEARVTPPGVPSPGRSKGRKTRSLTMPAYEEEMDKGLLLLAACLLVGSVSGQIHDKVHKTHAAAGKPNELGCFICDTMEDGERCGQVNQNETQWRNKCKDERRMCMVKRFSYTTANENSTSDVRMWYLERNCTHRCEPGCIVIGERTKLYACTACCEKPFCNWMSAAAKTLLPFRPILAILLISIAAAGPS